MKNYLTQLEIIAVGDPGVGKSSLLQGYTTRNFKMQEVTIGPKLSPTEMIVEGGGLVRLMIWDTAGMERFRSMTPSYYRKAQGIILVYDVTDRSSFNGLDHWFKEVDAYLPRPEVVKILVGNKSDLEKKTVTMEEGQILAQKHGCLFEQISAKNIHEVETVFQVLVHKILATPTLWEKLEDCEEKKKSPEKQEESSYCSC